MNELAKCKECNGTGLGMYPNLCYSCDGTGVERYPNRSAIVQWLESLQHDLNTNSKC